MLVLYTIILSVVYVEVVTSSNYILKEEFSKTYNLIGHRVKY